TFVNAGADQDAVTVSNSGLVTGVGALLTVTGDVPQVTVTRTGRGSAADPATFTDGANEVQRLIVDATGGTFRVAYKGAATGDLPHDVSAADLKTALGNLAGIGAGNVKVDRFGNAYRIEFVNGLAETAVDLLGANDLGLTAEGPGDVLTVDNSADTTDDV